MLFSILMESNQEDEILSVERTGRVATVELTNSSIIRRGLLVKFDLGIFKPAKEEQKTQLGRGSTQQRESECSYKFEEVQDMKE
jgi:hypothetical protein